MISHAERLLRTLKGEKPDRPPIALWRHFPVDDQSPDALAAATLHFQQTYDFDLVKVTPASSFCVRDWGAEDEWTGDAQGTRKYTKRVIIHPQDWERLPELEPKSPHLAGQLACLGIIRKNLKPETPLLQTIFSPLAQAKNLAGNDSLIAHIRQHPEAVLRGLETIAITTKRFVEAASEAGIDGVFFAVQHAQAASLTPDEYSTFGLPNDLKVIEAANGLWCNMLHLHGREIYFSLLQNLNFPIINWHDRETAPTLREARSLYPGVVCGGLRQDTIVFKDQEKVKEEALDAIRQTRGIKFILGTGCVVPVIAGHGNLMAARKSVE